MTTFANSKISLTKPPRFAETNDRPAGFGRLSPRELRKLVADMID